MPNRTVVLGDVHGNLDALDAVLDSVGDPEGIELVCLGDMVGYGPDPGVCLDRLRDHDARMILGNHDAAVLGTVPLDVFNPMARAAAQWTRQALAEEHLECLRNLDVRVTTPCLTGVHGTPREPLMEYLMNAAQAAQSAHGVSTPLLGAAHTHRPALYRPETTDRYRSVSLEWDCAYSFSGGGSATVVNPGSVGQPRDGDPRACYLEILPDETELRWQRVSYPVERTQTKIRDAGLPPFLAERLAQGQ